MPPSHPAAAIPISSLAYPAYDLVGALATVLAAALLPFLVFSRRGGGIAQRLGVLPQAVTRLQRPLWIHAASVGEILAAEPLLRELRHRRPDLPILVSTTSLTGRATAQDRLAADAVMLLPADIGWITGRVMRRIRPCGLVIVETELWPALLRAAGQNGVPTLIVSGKISARSARRYARIRWLTRAMLQHVTACLMQSPADAERLIEMGAPAERVEVVGSLKFARHAGGIEARAPAGAARLGERPTLIAASTHAGEEELIIEACGRVWATHPTALLILAPRRPERFDEVARLLRQGGLNSLRRSQLDGTAPADIQVLLLDTIGELLDFMPGAHAVFVGGTIAPQVGGHNVLEPAVFGKPVLFGPHTDNVAAAAAALLAAGAARRITNAAELGAEWQRLLSDPAAAAAMGALGCAVVTSQADVARRTAELVCRAIEPAGSAAQLSRAGIARP